MAIGGACGAGFEYADADHVGRHDTLVGYVRDPVRPGLAYARGFQGLPGSVRTGEEFLARIRPDTDKSGAAMRVVPVGPLPDVLHHSDVQPRVTHDTPDGVAPARAAALAVHYCHRGLRVGAGRRRRRVGRGPAGLTGVGDAVAGRGGREGRDERAGRADGVPRGRSGGRAVRPRPPVRCGRPAPVARERPGTRCGAPGPGADAVKPGAPASAASASAASAWR
ncbi:hypothetical protein CKY47_32090 [Saccharothrix yanglingensis]|uniref:Uncharacterized protein n=2 Tax=Saccharothrix yanglingensis TaxID=659496 RepID=A0ABU0X974_9PSEU|nr:hypothetical protein [Saccharothrix yanglingensis]